MRRGGRLGIWAFGRGGLNFFVLTLFTSFVFVWVSFFLFVMGGCIGLERGGEGILTHLVFVIFFFFFFPFALTCDGVLVLAALWVFDSYIS